MDEVRVWSYEVKSLLDFAVSASISARIRLQTFMICAQRRQLKYITLEASE